jgi:hypothetical protein
MNKYLLAVIVSMCVLNIAIFYAKHQPVKSEPVVVTPIQEPEVEAVPPKPVETIPEFVEVPVFRESEQGSIYGDVLSHSQERPFGDHSGRFTNVHETGHGIHSYLRNKYTDHLKNRVNGFYGLNGRGIIVEEPSIVKSQINDFVPKSVRGYRFSLYLDGQKAWEDTPLYIYDEWNAYVLGGKCCVDDFQSSRYRGGNVDGVSGCLEFSIYSIAVCMAVKEHDPSYWENNKQFRAFTIWNLKESYKTFMVGRVMDKFKWDKQDAMLNALLTAKDADPMRKFIQQNLEGVWLDANPEELKTTYKPEQCKFYKMEKHTSYRP